LANCQIAFKCDPPLEWAPWGGQLGDYGIDPCAGLSKDGSPWPSTARTAFEFKRQVTQEFLTGETLHGLAKRHDISRNLIRVWVQKYEAGDFDETLRPPISCSSMKPASPQLERQAGHRIG
jgi:transposase